ncbi:hypothetical protein [Pseudobacteriovorax antillogorgiicola]|uniref:Uncharacterized protein n=1 Tax=Pseudobacteriovorax antillogorgiicola TaxID=1513793 RepID=A0A1Y6CLT7_9BACT|nr:hypothetical protein [Pseudobacteriovorax antillogorgiicola]TCS45673.1 hypothetical protein EDD56_12767 [Pseudobacteriovorax antillogorgiicola]SMF73108.1 hypothetical protein SAMN06296036_12766 [Pseudobacteriovorax antillogorgiicola]
MIFNRVLLSLSILCIDCYALDQNIRPPSTQKVEVMGGSFVPSGIHLRSSLPVDLAINYSVPYSHSLSLTYSYNLYMARYDTGSGGGRSTDNGFAEFQIYHDVTHHFLGIQGTHFSKSGFYARGGLLASYMQITVDYDVNQGADQKASIASMALFGVSGLGHQWRWGENWSFGVEWLALMTNLMASHRTLSDDISLKITELDQEHSYAIDYLNFRLLRLIVSYQL